MQTLTNDESAVLKVLIDEEPGYVPWPVIADETGLDEAAVHRAALGLISKAMVECVTEGGIGYERSATQRALDGTPFPGRPGYLTARCGHAISGSEWRVGIRTCEHCGC